MQQLTGSSSCQVPVGNHLPQQFDYLFLSKDAQMVLFCPSLKPPSACVPVLCLSVFVILEFLWLKLLKREETVPQGMITCQIKANVLLFSGNRRQSRPTRTTWPNGRHFISLLSPSPPHQWFIVLGWKSLPLCSRVRASSSRLLKRICTEFHRWLPALYTITILVALCFLILNQQTQNPLSFPQDNGIVFVYHIYRVHVVDVVLEDQQGSQVQRWETGPF